MIFSENADFNEKDLKNGLIRYIINNWIFV